MKGATFHFLTQGAVTSAQQSTEEETAPVVTFASKDGHGVADSNNAWFCSSEAGVGNLFLRGDASTVSYKEKKGNEFLHSVRSSGASFFVNSFRSVT